MKNLLVLSLFLQTTQADKTETLPQSTSDQQPDNENTSLPEHRLPDNLFGKGIWSSALQIGAALDLRNAQEHPDHNFALSSFQLNYNLSGIIAESRWYRGNWQLGGELRGVAQVSSEKAYLVGVLPVLTYNFVTRTPWTPYLQVAAGVAVTDIGLPDLGTEFEFTEHADVGLRWQVRNHLALQMSVGIMHVSNAGIKKPNSGITAGSFLLGVVWSF